MRSIFLKMFPKIKINNIHMSFPEQFLKLLKTHNAYEILVNTGGYCKHT